MNSFEWPGVRSSAIMIALALVLSGCSGGSDSAANHPELDPGVDSAEKASATTPTAKEEGN